MVTKYDHHHHHPHHHHNTQQDHHHKSIFLPMFCRLSLKDVNLNIHHRHPAAAAADPSSPKVSCIGQVKRNNRVISFPATSTAAASKRPKKPISTKTFLPNAAAGAAVRGADGGGRKMRSRSRVRSDGDCVQLDDQVVVVVDIGEMDPPLPVVKRAAAPPGGGREEVNIWRRRFNGVAELKSLEIEKMRHSPTLTV